jgi:hypothetical protein
MQAVCVLQYKRQLAARCGFGETLDTGWALIVTGVMGIIGLHWNRFFLSTYKYLVYSWMVVMNTLGVFNSRRASSHAMMQVAISVIRNAVNPTLAAQLPP